MSLADLVWVSVAAYGLHIVEEAVFDLPARVRRLRQVRLEWADFYVINAFVVLLGIVCAQIASTLPLVALAFPALMLTNSLVHIGASVASGWRYTPGIASAVLLFWPLGAACFLKAASDATLNFATMLGSFAIAIGLHGLLAVSLTLRDKGYFRARPTR